MQEVNAKMQIAPIRFQNTNFEGKIQPSKVLSEIRGYANSESISRFDALEKHLSKINDNIVYDFARKNNGISISFNGNEYPLKVAEIAIVSPSAVTTAVIANIYVKLVDVTDEMIAEDENAGNKKPCNLYLYSPSGIYFINS